MRVIVRETVRVRGRRISARTCDTDLHSFARMHTRMPPDMCRREQYIQAQSSCIRYVVFWLETCRYVVVLRVDRLLVGDACRRRLYVRMRQCASTRRFYPTPEARKPLPGGAKTLPLVVTTQIRCQNCGPIIASCPSGGRYSGKLCPPFALHSLLQ